MRIMNDRIRVEAINNLLRMSKPFDDIEEIEYHFEELDNVPGVYFVSILKNGNLYNNTTLSRVLNIDDIALTTLIAIATVSEFKKSVVGMSIVHSNKNHFSDEVKDKRSCLYEKVKKELSDIDWKTDYQIHDYSSKIEMVYDLDCGVFTTKR